MKPVRTPGRMLRAFPLSLTILRVALAPALIVCVGAHASGIVIASLIIAAMLSDIYDGILARRWGVSTAALRRFDSIADVTFYAAVVLSAAIWQQQALWACRVWLAAFFVAMTARYGYDLAKLHRPSSYHTYLSKSCGLLLAAAAIALLAYGISGWLAKAALAVGVLAELQDLAISAILPVAKTDVPTLWRALEIRRQLLANAAK